MRILPPFWAFLCVVGCTRPALPLRPATHPGDAPLAAVASGGEEGRPAAPAGSTVAAAATYHAGTGTAAGPTREETPRPAVPAAGKHREAAPVRTTGPGNRMRVDPAHWQLRQGAPDGDVPAKRRVNRLSLLSTLVGLAYWIPVVLISSLVTTSLDTPGYVAFLSLGLLTGAAGAVLGIRGANQLEAEGEKGGLLSFFGVLLGVLAIIAGFIGTVAILLFLLFG